MSASPSRLYHQAYYGPLAAARHAVHAYQKQHDVTLPHRGVVHDLGPTTTHKVQAIELKLRGLLTQEIARRIHHDPANVDAYLSDFERIYQLHRDGKTVKQIAFLIKRSASLVREYIGLIDAYVEADPHASRSSKPAGSEPSRPRSTGKRNTRRR